MVFSSHDSVARYVFQFLLVFFPKVADQVLTEQVSIGLENDDVGGSSNDGDCGWADATNCITKIPWDYLYNLWPYADYDDDENGNADDDDNMQVKSLIHRLCKNLTEVAPDYDLSRPSQVMIKMMVLVMMMMQCFKFFRRAHFW